ncbi:MAG: dihydrofolate reductase [Methylophilaceae bacterium]|jgi:dihydrofolate reductase
MTKLSIIVAVANDNVIGINNAMPWHLPEDLKRFKALTMGHHIVMGRKTYESLGRLLPGRTTVIVTRNKDYAVEGAIVAHGVEDALATCTDDEEVFLIGGAELYQQGITHADKIYMTEVHADFAGDAFLPNFDLSQWDEEVREAHMAESGLHFSYVTYVRQSEYEKAQTHY